MTFRQRVERPNSGAPLTEAGDGGWGIQYEGLEDTINEIAKLRAQMKEGRPIGLIQDIRPGVIEQLLHSALVNAGGATLYQDPDSPPMLQLLERVMVFGISMFTTIGAIEDLNFDEDGPGLGTLVMPLNGSTKCLGIGLLPLEAVMGEPAPQMSDEERRKLN